MRPSLTNAARVIPRSGRSPTDVTLPAHDATLRRMNDHLQRFGHDAVVYGLPSVDLHRILVNFALDRLSPEYKAPLNTFAHARNLADPSDRSIVAMNVETPYSYVWLDLHAEPVVLTMPDFEADRYVSAEIFDLYTFIVGYVSPRTNGSAGGQFLIRGPGWVGQPPPGMPVYECPTELSLVLVRTQLFDDADLPGVIALQDQMSVQSLPSWLGQPRPLDVAVPPVPDLATVDVRAPLDGHFLHVLDVMLALMPVLPGDEHLRTELASIGVGGPGLADLLDDPPSRAALEAGMAQGMTHVLQRCAEVRSSAEIFGSREHFRGDHLSRAAGAYLGILGNAAEEYLGVGYQADADGQPFHGTRQYRIRFAPDGLPEVAAFWSITLYDADRLRYANELDRYVLGSRQLDSMVRDPDGGLTILVQHQPPADGLLPNWLPAPAGDFSLAFRTYLPGPAIRSGAWTAPPVQRTDPQKA